MSCCRLETESLLLRPQGADDIPADRRRSWRLRRREEPRARAASLYGGRCARLSGPRHRRSRTRPVLSFRAVPEGRTAVHGRLRLQAPGGRRLRIRLLAGQAVLGQGLCQRGGAAAGRVSPYELKAPTSGRAGSTTIRPPAMCWTSWGVPAGVEHAIALARGHDVSCHNVVLEREDFGRNREKQR